MSKLFILPFVSSGEAEEIYRKFDPFTKQTRTIRGCEALLKLIGLALTFSLVAGISDGGDIYIALLVLLVSIYGAICFSLIFWRLNLEDRKRVAFVENNPHLLRFLFPK
jgi:hypothetical protein